MSAKNSLSPEELQVITKESLALLARHALFHQPLDDAEFSSSFRGKRQTGLTQKQLDQITLEFALIFIGAGFGNVHSDEFLNGVRREIVELLETMNYEKPQNLCEDAPARWGCYQLWVEVARLGGATEPEIAERREQCRIKHGGDYEEESGVSQATAESYQKYCPHRLPGKCQGLAYKSEPVVGGGIKDRFRISCFLCGKFLGYARQGLGGTMELEK